MNLLSHKQKDVIRKDVFSRLLFVFLGIVFLSAMVFLVLAYNSVLYLELQIPAIEERLRIEQETQKANIVMEVESDIEDLNDILLTIDKIRKKESFNFPYILRVLGRMAPEGVVFRTITFRGENIGIQGHAEGREGVLALKKNLEEEPLFTNIFSPLSNIVKERDINFTFNFAIDEK